MISRERMQIALSGGKPDVVPTYLCYHSLYLNRHTTLEYFVEYLRRMGESDRYPIDAQEDLEIRREVIKQTIDLFSGRVDHQFGFPNVRGIECKEISKKYIELAISYVDAESVRIFDDGDGAKVEGITPHGNWNRGAKLESKTDVDNYFAPNPSTHSPIKPDDVRLTAASTEQREQEAPYADLRELHRNAIADSFRVGGFTTPFVSAIGAFSYQGTMEALLDKPKVFGYFIERATEGRLQNIRSSTHVDGFWFDEYYTDVISPEHYDEYVFQPNLRLAQAVKESGKLCMYYFCGDIMAKLDKALALEVDAIAFEESKKWFKVDIAEVKKRVGSQKALVGNMDGLHLLPKGTKKQIDAEVKRQLSVAAKDGGFVMGAGSPIAPDTPTENMLVFLDATRKLGKYPLEWEDKNDLLCR